MKRLFAALLVSCSLLTLLAGCGANASANGKSVTLILGAYSAPQEVYARLIPMFQQQWKQQTGQDVTFKQSYLGSGAQSRAIVNGFQADVAALSVAPDVDAIAKAGLITHDWTNTPTKGMVSTSIVAFAVRKGNPKGIHDWADLARPGIQILTPDPKTSGGAQWNILALYGAAMRGYVTGVAQNDPHAALTFLEAVLKNVKAFDKDARTSITNFEQGVGDVAITYESEVLTAQAAGKDDDLVIPTSTILIQTPAAVVDANVNRHGTRKVAEAFVAFLASPAAQQVFASSGYRPIDATVAQANAAKYPAVTDLWTIDFLGGWKAVKASFFGDSGIYVQALAAVQGQ
ncbi:MAG: Sulfate and thiosulfate binding protein CysP [Ktedonobacterales bacterium]|jgi:sulfate transport system substrate-binding protein|nr:MAG: Sulfate and thiosulfate binding protein CysP [Ktedonobacterales bacterium]